jgi:RND superfamily putative drug exporter
MRSFMGNLAGSIARHRKLVVGVWLALLVVAMPLAAKQTTHLTGGGFDVPGSQSKVVEDATERDFAAAQHGRLAFVVQVERGADAMQQGAAMGRLRKAVGEVDHVELTPRTEAAAMRDLGTRGVAIVPLEAHGRADDLIDTAVELREKLTLGTPVDGSRTYLTGQPALWAGMQEVSKEDLASAEMTGFPIVALILVAVFGSLAAASLPLALGFVAVLVTGAAIYLISMQMQMSVFVTNMASMVGIGVAVDYSLFILARFREEVRAGKSEEEARVAAMETSGLAVAFSGMAVIVSLAGLWMVDNQALRSMALGAMVVVAIAILTAITLLPALIRLLGHRVEAGGIAYRFVGVFRRGYRNRRRSPGATRGEVPTFWTRWTAAVMRRPVLSVVGVSAVLLTLASPVLWMETGTGALDQFPRDHDARVGTELASRVTGGGTDSVRVLAQFRSGDLSTPANRTAVDQLAARLKTDSEVREVAPPLAGRESALLSVVPRHAGESQQTTDFVDRARDSYIPNSALASRADVNVGGEGARLHDAQIQISGSMGRIIAFILAFSFIVLMVMLRSIVLPLKAIVMNLLSIGAAYGVLVAVFQWGWLDGFLGFHSLGALDTLNPPLILAVVFGLSMDYEVFLLSRIKERYEEHGDNKRAVAEGLASSARTISSAALIMAAVFSVFILTGMPSIKELGLGNAVAIILDATLVRLILVPAAMQLMGRWNWWLPSWLDRVLPHVSLEGGRPAAPGAQPA